MRDVSTKIISGLPSNNGSSISTVNDLGTIQKYTDRAYETSLTGLETKYTGSFMAGVYWEDLRVSVGALKLSGSKPPLWTSYKGGEVLAFSDESIAGNEEIIYFIAQMPHAWKEGSEIDVHIHWIPEDTTAGNVRWLFTYSWASVGGDFPSEKTIVGNFAAPGVADRHAYADLGEFDATGQTISSMLICSLKRQSSNAGDTFTAKSAYLTEIDFHYQVDSLGSRQEATK